MGRLVRGAAVVRARAVRQTEHGRIVFMLWERALSLPQEGTWARALLQQRPP
jgi:hypothetical protein